MGRYTLIILAALALTLGYFIVSTNNSKRRAFEHTIDTFEAKTLEDMAVSGARVALNRLAKDTEWRTQQFSLRLDNTDVLVEVLDATVDTTIAPGEVLLRSTASIEDNETKQMKRAITEVTVQVGTIFSDNAWVIDDLGNTNLANGVNIRGGFHTNNNLNIVRNPIFGGPITATGNVIYGHGNTTTYNVGYHDAVEVEQDFSDLMTPSANGFRLVGDSEIVFNGDGTMSVNGIRRTVRDGYIFYSTSPITVSGNVDCNVTIYTKDELYIPNDILYKDYSDDMLTLIAEGDLLLRAKRDSTLTIRANMYTHGDNGVVFMTDRNNPWSVTHKSHFDIFGSLVQFSLQPIHAHRHDQPFGTSSNSDKQFDWYLAHDERLKNTVPPGMPSQFRITNWRDI